MSFIPYSCCENEETCYQNIIPILLKDQKINVPAIDTSVINEKGCLYGLLYECQWVITMIISATIVVFVVQVKRKNFKLLFKGIFSKKVLLEWDFCLSVYKKATKTLFVSLKLL